MFEFKAFAEFLLNLRIGPWPEFETDNRLIAPLANLFFHLRAKVSGGIVVNADLGIAREPHHLGDIVRMSLENAVLATYFRNNVLHLLALPSLIACVFVSNARVATRDIQRLNSGLRDYLETLGDPTTVLPGKNWRAAS